MKKAAKKLKIGEFSDAIGMNPSQIRYYEKLGLISSHRDEDNNYRGYEPQDSLHLINMKTLRSLGLSVKESQTILSGTEESRCIWEMHISSLEKQIRQLKEVKKAALYYYRNTEETSGPCIEMVPARYFLQVGCWGTMEPADINLYAKTIREWGKYMPEAGYWGVFDVNRFRNSEKEALRSGYSILKECVERESVSIPPEAEEFPECRCLKWIYENEAADFWNPKSVEKIFCWAEKRNLRLSGNGLWHFLQNIRRGETTVLRYLLYFPISESED